MPLHECGSELMPPGKAPQGTQSVLRAIRLLKAFSPEWPELTLAQLCDSIGLAKTTAYRLLSALESEGLVARDNQRNTYHLGPAAIALGSQALLSSNLRLEVRSTLESLAERTGETTTLEILVGDQMLVLDGVPGRHMISANLDVGTRWPVHVTSTGKCVLAFMPEAEREHLQRLPLVRFTDKTVVDLERLHSELETIRQQGFGTAFEELEEGYVGVAAVFRDSLGRIEGAISLGGPASRLTPQRVSSLGTTLRAAADVLSRRH